jgi:hypothetical protein
VNTDLPSPRPDDPFGFPGDLLGDLLSTDPGLDALLGRLTADPEPDELAGENAALAMFRANHAAAPRLAYAAAPDRARGSVTARRAGRRRGHRARFIAAAVTLAAAGFAVAAYTEALPAPLQQAAYHALGFAGVPSAHHHPAPAAAASSSPTRTGSHGAAPSPSGSRHASAPASRPSTSSQTPGPGQAALSITVASGRVVAGQSVTCTGRLTDRAGGVPGATLNLLERAAGQPGWQPAGTAATGSNGEAVLTVTDLTTNAAFRLKGPDATLSGPVLVIVVPPIRASVGKPGRASDMITASSPLASAGDTVVLQVLAAGHWQSTQKAHLNAARQAGFAVPVTALARQREYRVVLLPTAAHAMSVSNAVMISLR